MVCVVQGAHALYRSRRETLKRQRLQPVLQATLESLETLTTQVTMTLKLAHPQDSKNTNAEVAITNPPLKKWSRVNQGIPEVASSRNCRPPDLVVVQG